MIHPPTFYYRFYLSRVSPLLLDAMYAFVAHLSTNPKFLSTLSPNTPTWARGEAFAERARHSAKRMISLRASWSEEERRLDRGTWEETEFTQALFLLSFYFVATRQSSLGLYFLDVAIEILRPASTATVPPPSPLLNLSPIEYSTLMEARNRTFWLLVLDDLCAAANGRPRILMDHEIYNVPLPGDETQWERWGGGGSSGRETARRDGLALGTGNWQGEEGLVGELGHVLRIVSCTFWSMVEIKLKGLDFTARLVLRYHVGRESRWPWWRESREPSSFRTSSQGELLVQMTRL